MVPLIYKVSPQTICRIQTRKLRKEVSNIKVTGQRKVESTDRRPEHFNGGEHLFVEIAANEYQTISCKLPNGKFVTFAFIPAGNSTQPSNEIECVDLHSNVGTELPRSVVGYIEKCRAVITLRATVGA